MASNQWMPLMTYLCDVRFMKLVRSRAIPRLKVCIAEDAL